jgi:hypothetical protein
MTTVCWFLSIACTTKGPALIMDGPLVSEVLNACGVAFTEGG